jgi:dephospho-CoA kinase
MPSQHPFRPWPNEPVFVGFAGRIGAGKTSAAMYLTSKYQFHYTRYSRVLQQWQAADGDARERLQEFGWDVMAGGLQTELNARLIGALDRSRSASIDGLRHSIDFECLSKAFSPAFGMVFLEAGEELRYARLKQRYATFEAFQVADSHPVEAHIDGLRSLATLTLLNESSLENLHERLDAWLTDCGVRSRA